MNNKIFLLYLLGLVILILGSSCAYYNTLFNAKKAYESGIEIIQEEPEKEKHPQANQYFEQTIEKCWKLIEIYGEDSKYADDALLYIVKSEFYIQKYAQALVHAKAFLNKYPDSDLFSEANLWYGKILIADEKIEEGKKLLNKSLTITDESNVKAQANYELGSLAFKNENYEDAISFFEKALKENISEQYAAFIQFYLAESYFQQEKYEDAINRYKKVEEFSPSLDIEYKTQFNLARSYAEIQKFESALEILRKMLTAPRFKKFVPFIKTEIANIYDKQNNLTDALTLYKEVVKDRANSEGTALASFKLAKIYENRIENVDSAVYYYEQVKRLYNDFDSVEVAENKRVFLSELKKIRDSIRKDSRLVYRLENDPVFRDSLYTAQYEDSIRQLLEEMSPKSGDQRQKSPDDTTSVPLDSLRNLLNDSTALAEQDTSDEQDTGEKQTESKEPAEEDFQNFRKSLMGETEELNEKEQKDEKQSQKKELKKQKKQLERRKLPEIREDLKKGKYHLAEFYLLQVQNYDSAKYYYKRFLNTYRDSVLTPKALYSLYFIYSQPGYVDSTKKDSLEKELISQFPKSSFTQKIMKKKGLLKQPDSTDSLSIVGKNLFRKAEKLYEKNLLDSALAVYKKVATLDTNLLWSAKAQLARAWIYENDLKQTNKAIDEYRFLKENYSQPEFISLAAKKIAPPAEEKEEKVSEKTDQPIGEAEVSDTTKIAASTQEASTIIEPERKLSTEDLPRIKDYKRYLQWRRSRSKLSQ